MGNVQFYNNKVLFTPANKVAMDPDCCCRTPGWPCEYCSGNTPSVMKAEVTSAISPCPAGQGPCSQQVSPACLTNVVVSMSQASACTYRATYTCNGYLWMYEFGWSSATTYWFRISRGCDAGVGGDWQDYFCTVGTYASGACWTFDQSGLTNDNESGDCGSQIGCPWSPGYPVRGYGGQVHVWAA